jgi:hypothetical protein
LLRFAHSSSGLMQETRGFRMAWKGSKNLEKQQQYCIPSVKAECGVRCVCKLSLLMRNAPSISYCCTSFATLLKESLSRRVMQFIADKRGKLVRTCNVLRWSYHQYYFYNKSRKLIVSFVKLVLIDIEF